MLLLSKVNIDTGEVVWKSSMGNSSDDFIVYCDSQYTYISKGLLDASGSPWIRGRNLIKIDNSDGSEVWSHTYWRDPEPVYTEPHKIIIGEGGIFEIHQEDSQQTLVVTKRDSDFDVEWSKEIVYTSPDHPSFTYAFYPNADFGDKNLKANYVVGANYLYIKAEWESNDYYPSYPSHHKSNTFIIAIDVTDGSEGWKASIPPGTFGGNTKIAYGTGTVSIIDTHQIPPTDYLHLARLDGDTGAVTLERDMYLSLGKTEGALLTDYIYEVFG